MPAKESLDVGDKVPDFALAEATGAERRLSELAAGGRVVLVFYRGYW